MAMRRGGAGADGGETTHIPIIGPVQKMVLLRLKKAVACLCGIGGPGADRDRRSRRFEAKTSDWTWPEGSWTPRGPGSRTQKDRSCAGKTTERGTETGLTGCREAVITNVARFRAPADIPCASGGIGRRAWSYHGAEPLA